MTKVKTFHLFLIPLALSVVCGLSEESPVERSLNETHPFHPKQEYHPYHPYRPKKAKKELRSQAPAEFNRTIAPTGPPTESPAPSPSPSSVPTQLPTSTPSSSPTKTPTTPSDSPTDSPAPSPSPSENPTLFPSARPTLYPSLPPSASPSVSPSSWFPSATPSSSIAPSFSPSSFPTHVPSQAPSISQAPSGALQPYVATEIKIEFENVASSFNMDGDDVDLFEKTAKEYLNSSFLPSNVDEIHIEAVTVTAQSLAGANRKLSSVRSTQTYNLSLTFNVMALVKHDWGDQFDLKEAIDAFFRDDAHVLELRAFVESNGGDFFKDVPSTSGSSAPIGAIIGPVVGSLLVFGVIAKLFHSRKHSSHQSKISLASTDSRDDDESSEAQMLSAATNPSKQQLKLLFSPREDDESRCNNPPRPSYLKTDSNIEIPETPIGFTPPSTRKGIFATNTPKSIFSAKNSTKSTFRRFLMDTPPSAMNSQKKTSRGFFPPPRSAGRSQKNLRHGMDTIDMSPVPKDFSKAEENPPNTSPIRIFTEQDFIQAKAKAAATDGGKSSKKKAVKASASIDNGSEKGRFRLRKWPSDYISDESSSEA
eukprot:scaffold2563_cov124-Cylindrotheca_fusiformis.AAC.5